MSKSFWLHRISHHAEVAYPLIERGLLSIGWSDFSENKNFVGKCYDNWDNFEKAFDDKWGERPRNRYNLWRFLTDMKKGDYVLVPSWGTFSVFEILEDKPLITTEIDITNLTGWNKTPIVKGEGEDDYLYYNDKEKNIIDLGFFRKITPIVTDISRYDFADSPLTSRMKVRQTNVNIDDLKESIENAIKAYRENKPINLHSLILESSLDNTLGIIKKELNPDKFEALIMWYFKRIGANEAFIPAKNEPDKEGDADIIASFEAIKTIIYVQAKFHSGVTSSWAMEQIDKYKGHKETMDDGYSKIGWVISTADNYSKECLEKAKSNNIQLIDGKQFTKMLLEVGISHLHELF